MESQIDLDKPRLRLFQTSYIRGINGKFFPRYMRWCQIFEQFLDHMETNIALSTISYMTLILICQQIHIFTSVSTFKKEVFVNLFEL